MALNVHNIFPGERSPDVTIAGCIDIFENAWPNPGKTIDMIEQACLDPDSSIAWRRAATNGRGPRQDVRTNLTIEVSECADIYDNKIMQHIHNQFYLLLLATTIPYSQRYDMHEGLWHEGYQLLKYRGGEEYKAHYDGGTHLGRAISAIVYFNNDYEGGELEFVNFDVRIKPEPGMLILFPSNYAYRHIAHPVTKGNKYALVTWIKDREI